MRSRYVFYKTTLKRTHEKASEKEMDADVEVGVVRSTHLMRTIRTHYRIWVRLLGIQVDR